MGSMATPHGDGVVAVDPNEPKIIASFQLPYKVVRDIKHPGNFKVSLAIPKHVNIIKVMKNKLLIGYFIRFFITTFDIKAIKFQMGWNITKCRRIHRSRKTKDLRSFSKKRLLSYFYNNG